MSELKWRAPNGEEIRVESSPWMEVDDNGAWLFYRLPRHVQPKIHPDTWVRSRMSAGISLMFRTESPKVGFRLYLNGDARNPGDPLLELVGSDGSYRTAEWPQISQPDGIEHESVFELSGDPEVVYRLYLPIYSTGDLLAVGTAPGARMWAADHPSGRIYCAHGSSITHGACASRPTRTYPERIGRGLGLRTINMGYGGNALAQIEIARVLADLEWDVLSLELGINTYGHGIEPADIFAESHHHFIQVIRHGRPEAPIVVLTPIAYPRVEAAGNEPNASGSRLEDYREAIRWSISQHRKAGDERIWLVEGPSLLGVDEAHLFDDGLHPSDEGFEQMADRLLPYIKAALRGAGSQAP